LVSAGYSFAVRSLSALAMTLTEIADMAGRGDDRLELFSDRAMLAHRSLSRIPEAAASLRVVVYAKRPFAGPASVLAYLARYTHRVRARLPATPLWEAEENLRAGA
jgi:hypothetical protein